MNRAVFLDRDGVLNRLTWNPLTQAYESPHCVEDFELYPWTLKAVSQLQAQGYWLFLVSNQPSFAKGKTSLENIKAIQAALHESFTKAGITFHEYYYCYHHPNGLVPELTCDCACRKPKPFFLFQAQTMYQLDMPNSWMIGDQDSDIFCGQAAGVRTIQITEPHSLAKRGESVPDRVARDLLEADEIIHHLTNE